MGFRICKTFEVESGHMLSKHPDKCRFPHGHTRKVECVLSSATLDDNEMVCDFKLVKILVGEFVEQFDHSLCVNTADPEYGALKAAYGERVIGFENADPTTEVLAKTIFVHLRAQLLEYAKGPQESYLIRRSVSLERVRVWETSSSWAEYCEE